MRLSSANIKSATRAMVGALTAAGALLQVQPVRDFLVKQFEGHPHILSLIGIAVGVFGLLHNPQVKAVLHAADGPSWMTTDQVVEAEEKK